MHNKEKKIKNKKKTVNIANIFKFLELQLV